jgi:hypothetical protein
MVWVLANQIPLNLQVIDSSRVGQQTNVLKELSASCTSRINFSAAISTKSEARGTEQTQI